MSHIRCHRILLRNDVTVDWSSVCACFGTCSAPGARMRARGLVYPLFVTQTTWFGMPNVCSAKEDWVERGIEGHEVRDNNNVQVRLRLREEPMGNTKLLLPKGRFLIRGELGGVRAVWMVHGDRRSWDKVET